MSTKGFTKGKLYRFLDYVLRLVLLNFCVVVPSFIALIIYSLFSKNTDTIWFYLTLVPVVLWLFPSITAVTDVIRQYEDNLTTTIFKDFFVSIKRNYVKSFIIGIFVYVLVILLYNSLNFFYVNQGKGAGYIIGLFLSASFSVMVLCLIVHLPLVVAYFSNLKVIEYIKLALMLGFRDIGKTILMIIASIIIIIISILSYYIMFIIGISMMIYCLVKLSFKQYIKIYRKVEEKNDEEN